MWIQYRTFLQIIQFWYHLCSVNKKSQNKNWRSIKNLF
jgi:hypothetical protein